jgi:hypothetical protein
MKALADTSAPGDDLAYRQAFGKLVGVVRMLHDRDATIVGSSIIVEYLMRLAMSRIRWI